MKASDWSNNNIFDADWLSFNTFDFDWSIPFGANQSTLRHLDRLKRGSRILRIDIISIQ